jgi:hypothetical protein
MLRLLIIAALTLVAASPALANGGTIRRSEPVPAELTTGSPPKASLFDNLGGWGRGRYRDSTTHQCRGRKQRGREALGVVYTFPEDLKNVVLAGASQLPSTNG